jgi:hypothetical protein
LWEVTLTHMILRVTLPPHILVQEQWAYHQEAINSCKPSPRTYSVGDIVFAQCAVQSDATKGVSINFSNHSQDHGAHHSDS